MKSVTDDDQVTLPERYIRASHSSHLRTEEGRCDADLLIAAGRSSSELGVLLWRLRGEFDAARASAPPQMSLTDRVLALMELRSLYACKQRLWFHVEEWLQFGRVNLDREQAAQLVGRMLDSWLDPTCSGCEGRGFNGGAHRGERRLRCRGCNGTGQRRDGIARSAAQGRLLDRVQTLMSEAMITTEREMRALLRDRMPGV